MSQEQCYWRIVKTENGHEGDVARALDKLGFETFLPMELRRHTSKGKPAAYVEAPLIPRRVFAKMELEAFLDLRERVREITGWEIGWEKDAEWFPETIPSVQMADFRECHAKWLQDCEKRALHGKLNGRGIKAKVRNMSFLDGLKLIQERMEARAE